MLDKLVAKWGGEINAEQEEPGYLVQCWECLHVANTEYADAPCEKCGALVETLYRVEADGKRTNYKQGKRP